MGDGLERQKCARKVEGGVMEKSLALPLNASISFIFVEDWEKTGD